MNIMLLIAVMVTTRQVYDSTGKLSESFIRERCYTNAQGQPAERVVYAAPDVLEYRELAVYQSGKLVHIRRLGMDRSPDTYPGVGYLLWRDIYPNVIEDRNDSAELFSVRIPGVVTVDLLTHTVTTEKTNAAGRLTSETSSDGTHRQYYYNTAGKQTMMIVTRGAVRLEKHTWIWIAKTCKYVKYTYFPVAIIPQWVDTYD